MLHWPVLGTHALPKKQAVADGQKTPAQEGGSSVEIEKVAASVVEVEVVTLDHSDGGPSFVGDAGLRK